MNDPLQKQADDLRKLNRELADHEERLRVAVETGRIGMNHELEHRILDRTRELEDSNRALLKEIEIRKELEEQLRQSEAYLAEAQRLSNVGSFSLTLPEGILTWSEETVRICEYPPGTPPSLDLAFARVHPDDVPGVHVVHEKAFRERSSLDFEHRLLMDDKSIKYVRVVARPARETKDSVTFVGAVMDLTRQKRAEQAIQASERVALGQVETLKEILNSISTELNPDKFLQHVLCTIARQLGGQSVSVFSRNNDDTLTLEALLEEGQLRIPKEKSMHSTQDQPLWAEAMRLGTECLVTEFDRDPIWFRFINRPVSEGVPRINDKTLPVTVEMHRRLKAQGVSLTLQIPMVASGRVSGFVGIRFTKRREFPPEEIDLSRALAHQAALAIQLMRLSRESQQAAIMAERNRMARDIHDTLAQGFTGVIAQLQAAILGGRPVYGAEEFQSLDPGDLPVMPDWSPVLRYPGHWKHQYTAHLADHHHHVGCSCRTEPTHHRARLNPMNIPQWLLGSRGLLDGGCECFAF